jgi:hypothetical protein
MKNWHLKSSQLIIYLVLSLLVWAYIWLRACKVQFSIDEAATFFMYIQSGRFIPPHAAIDANNHLLNSLLTWIFFKLFGSDPIVLRLPNVLAALIYFYFIYRISNLFNSKSIKWAFIVLSLGTHFIIEFFGYTRGYGMSMAFFSGAIYFLLICVRQVRLKYLTYTLLLLILGLMANLNLILSGLAMVAILFLFIFLQRKTLQRRVIIKGILLILLFSIPSFLFQVQLAFKLRAASAFYYGSGNGYFPVTIKSLVAMISQPYTSLVAIYSLLLAGSLTILLIIKSVRKDRNFEQLLPAWLFLALLGTNWIGSTILHIFKGVNFQEDRTAMHLLPLFYGFILFSFDSLLRKSKIIWLAVLLPFVLVPVYSFSRISLNNSVYGTNQQIPAEFYQLIRKIASNNDYPPVVSANQIKRQPWAFMNYRDGGTVNPLYISDHPWESADFIIKKDSLPEDIKNLYFMRLTDEITTAVLYERKVQPATSLFKVFELQAPLVSKGLYNNISQFSTDSITGKSLILLLDFNIESHSVPFEGVIVAEVFDQNRKNLKYEAIDLDQLRPEWNAGNNRLHHTMIISDIPKDGRSVQLYLWNKREVEFTIMHAKVTVKTIL